ncbi:unnamed protein product [Arabidopsis lyrata]|nr:unnamed protein product [Arabidopsis lyrata]
MTPFQESLFVYVGMRTKLRKEIFLEVAFTMDVLSLEETDEPDLKKYISAWKVASVLSQPAIRKENLAGELISKLDLVYLSVMEEMVQKFLDFISTKSFKDAAMNPI